MAQCSLGTTTPASLPRPTAGTAARAAWSRRRTGAAFLAAPLSRPGEDGGGSGSGAGAGGGLEYLLRMLRLDDAIFALPQQQQPRDGAMAPAAATAVAYATAYKDVSTRPPPLIAVAYNNISSRPPLSCWSKDQWTPRRDAPWRTTTPPRPSQRSHRQRTTTRLTWSKCQWSPTSYHPPSWRGISSGEAPAARLRRGRGAGAGGGGEVGARAWSKGQWSPDDHAKRAGHSRDAVTTLRGQGGIGGGAGAGARGSAAGGGAGGGAFNRVSFPPPSAAGAPSAPSPAGGAGLQQRRPTATVSRPAVASATVGSSGPKDLSGAPVEVRA